MDQGRQAPNWKNELTLRSVDLTRDSASDAYAQTVGLRVLRGRWFEPADDARNFDPIVIDSDLARDLYGNENPIGQKFDEASKREQRVVGVIAPYRKDGEFSHRMNMTFSRFSLDRPTPNPIPMYIIVRVKPGTTAELEEQMAKRIHELQPDISFRVRRMEAMRQTSLRIYLTPLVAGGVVALFLISMVTLGLTGVRGWRERRIGKAGDARRVGRDQRGLTLVPGRQHFRIGQAADQTRMDQAGEIHAGNVTRRCVEALDVPD